MTLRMGVVADDVTGSNDIGIMFAKAGCPTHVYGYNAPGDLRRHLAAGPVPQIAVLDTNSRLDARQAAYDKVFAATRELQAVGCRQYYNKTCSVFRGNIGAEFDAMLDAVGQDFAVVVLGFPKNGRVTLDGIHYVHGQRLEISEFRHDPVHPMTRSDLVGILQAQTARPVGLVTHEVVAQGAPALRECIDRLRGHFHYLIVDVPGQAGLRIIAQAVHDCPVLCGSSALAEELPAVWGIAGQPEVELGLPRRPGLGVLVAAGSLMPQTGAQIDHLRAGGMPVLALETPRVVDGSARRAEVERLSQAAITAMQAGRDVVVHTAREASVVQQTREAGAARGLTATQVARLVSDTLAEVVARALEATGQNRLVVAGGETSAAVCARLGITSQRIWQELQPGLPSCVSLNEPRRLLVLKSGSFGTSDFLAQAIEHVKRQ
jgi:uncharacterized protein YgbK (DUF1537 family)